MNESASFKFKWHDDYFRIEHHLRACSFNMPKNHYHDAYEVYYLISGDRYYFIKDRTYHITAGNLVLISPNELHKTNDASSPAHERIVINFKDTYLTNWCGKTETALLLNCFALNHPIVRLNLPQQNQLRELLLKMVTECRNRREEYQESVVYVKALLFELLILSGRCREQSSDQPLPTENAIAEKIFEAVRYINEHYMEDLSLPKIAGRFFISPHHFSRMFKKVTGFNFVEYLNNVRTKEAQKLLKESKLSVTEISERAGFESLTHFGRIFKKIAMVSPSYYRKNCS